MIWFFKGDGSKYWRISSGLVSCYQPFFYSELVGLSQSFFGQVEVNLYHSEFTRYSGYCRTCPTQDWQTSPESPSPVGWGSVNVIKWPYTAHRADVRSANNHIDVTVSHGPSGPSGPKALSKLYQSWPKVIPKSSPICTKVSAKLSQSCPKDR